MEAGPDEVHSILMSYAVLNRALLSLESNGLSLDDSLKCRMRSDWTTYRGGAVFLDGTEDCRLEDCFLDQVGGNAVSVAGMSPRSRNESRTATA